jgi:hypothetical protein
VQKDAALLRKCLSFCGIATKRDDDAGGGVALSHDPMQLSDHSHSDALFPPLFALDECLTTLAHEDEIDAAVGSLAAEFGYGVALLAIRLSDQSLEVLPGRRSIAVESTVAALRSSKRCRPFRQDINAPTKSAGVMTQRARLAVCPYIALTTGVAKSEGFGRTVVAAR